METRRSETEVYGAVKNRSLSSQHIKNGSLKKEESLQSQLTDFNDK